MDKFFKNLFKPENKGFKTKLMGIFAVGVMLMLAGPLITGSVLKGETEDTAAPAVYSGDYAEEELERRIEETLSRVAGAGQVKVMVTLSYSNEITVAEEIKREETNSEEALSGGGNKTTKSVSEENSVVLLEGKDGSKTPLVIKNYEPKIEGAVIVAEGGDSILVKDALTRAVQALFDLPAHKIQVLKMK